MSSNNFQSKFENEYLERISMSNNDTYLSIPEYVKNVYSDINLPENFAFRRKSAPLAALCYLYPKTVVYIPPTDKFFFEQNLNTTINEFKELIVSGIIQPVIGHPRYYENCDDLFPILDTKPPSVWARFDSACEKFNRAKYISDAERLLPLNELATLNTSQLKWKKHFSKLKDADLKKQIEYEWKNIFANLCVIGEVELATNIANLKEPEIISTFLQTANEMLIYPNVIGLGGLPQYDNSQNPSFKLFKHFDSTIDFQPSTVSKDILYLLKGINLNIDQQINVKQILKFHEDGLSNKLWATHTSLLNELQNRNENVEEKVNDYIELVNELKSNIPSFVQKDRKVATKVRLFSKGLVSASGITAAAAAYDKTWNALGIGVAAYQITDTLTKNLEPVLHKLFLASSLKKYQLYFWELSKQTGKM